MKPIKVNDLEKNLALDDETIPLLWILREELGVKGCKFGCGMGLCGACTVHVDNTATRSCITPWASVVGKEIRTIEGVYSFAKNERTEKEQSGKDHDKKVRLICKAVIDAWREFNVAQCGYCQPGQIMSATALLLATPAATSDEVLAHMSGNICRCGTYPMILKAIQSAQKSLEGVL